jgi:membrane-associated protease RseP (regulator of RpoE activity)
MPTVVAVLACIALVAVAELVRFGVARALRLPTARVAKVFVAFRGGPRWARAAAIFAGTLTTYLGVVGFAFLLATCAGMPTRDLECIVDEVPQGFPASGKLEKGDRIIAIDGRPFDRSPSLIFDEHNGGAVRFAVVRGNATRDVTIQPVGHDGHWIVGFRPRLTPVRTYDLPIALRRAFAFPLERAGELVPLVMGKEHAEPGGPKRIIDIYTFEIGPGELALRRAMQFGVYILVLVLLIDIARALRAVTRV